MTLVLIDKKIPTLPELATIMTNVVPTACDVENWGDYEENIEFDPLTLTYGDIDIVFGGYNGLHEMLSFDSLTDEAKRTFSDDMLEWIEEAFEYNELDTISDIEKNNPQLLK